MIKLTSSIPHVPLPDPLWYEYMNEIAPGLPDDVIDIVELTRDAERNGLTIVDLILYNSGMSPNTTLPRSRQSPSEGIVLVVSARDMTILGDIGIHVQCYEEGHPRQWVERYPNRLWLSRFWFGSIWFYHLGVEHIIADIPILLNRAWVSPLARLIPLQTEGQIHEAHLRVVELLPDLVNYLRSEWYGADRHCAVAG